MLTDTLTRKTDTVAEFLGKGFTEISVDPSLLAECLPVIKDGIRRMTDDKEARESFPYTVLRKDETGEDLDAGLAIVRDDETKDYFHYCKEHTWRLETNLERSFVPFLEACAALTTRAEANVQALVQSIDAMHRTHFAEHFRNQYVVTRILRYRRLKEQPVVVDAHSHFDRDAITHHWWASHPGLVIFDANDQACRVDETSWDRAALFPGKKFLGLTGGAFGLTGLHGVRDSRARNSVDDRIAIITFVHCSLPPSAVQWLKARAMDLKLIERAHKL